MNNNDMIVVCGMLVWLVAYIVVACKERGNVHWFWYGVLGLFVREIVKGLSGNMRAIYLMLLAAILLVILLNYAVKCIIHVVKWACKRGKNVSVLSAQKESESKE